METGKSSLVKQGRRSIIWTSISSTWERYQLYGNNRRKRFTTESPRYFIGNFTPGQSDHYNTMIIPEEAGELKGEIVFTFEDSAGNEHRETVPFDTTVVEGIVYGPDGTPMASGGDMANGQIAGNTSSSFVGSIWFWLIVIIALVGIIVVVMVIVKRNKSAKDLTLHD